MTRSILILNFIVSVFFSLGIRAENHVCTQGLMSNGSMLYRFEYTPSVCDKKENCWIAFMAPEDSIQIRQNGKLLVGLIDKYTYLSNESFILPLDVTNKERGVIEILSSDRNQSPSFPSELCLMFGRHEDIRWKSAFNWFFQTGITLYSSYFLLIISLFLFLSFWLRKSGLGLSLLTYSIVSFFYLISFSEYPRALFDPVMASGGIHFPLRLLQDVCLVYVFYNFFQNYESAKAIKQLTWIYAAVISMYLLLIVIGIRDYVYYARIIIFFAPLVAAPMAIGSWFAFKCKDKTERKVLIPASLLLLLFQVNDLFVFWKLVDGYFTVRFYIPLIVGMSLFLYFRRMHTEAISSAKSAERSRVFNEFLHDIKSPLAVLRIQNIDTTNPYRQKTIGAALDRIENMVTNIDSPTPTDLLHSFPVISTLNSVINQKSIEFPEALIRFESRDEVFTFAETSKLQRIISNLLNNSIESYEGEKAIIDIAVICNENEIVIRFSDYGKGISQDVLSRLSTEQLTTKEGGKGIGLTSARRYLKEIGGQIEVKSKINFGTTVDISIPATSSPKWFIEVFRANPSNMKIVTSSDQLELIWAQIKTNDVLVFEGTFRFNHFIETVVKTSNSAETVYILGDINFDDDVVSFFSNQGKVFYIKKLEMDENINLDLLDYVLIDDDKYVRLSWENHAKKVGHKIRTFPNVATFFAASQNIDRSCAVYLDLNINGEKTTPYFRSIRDLGFCKVILATGEHSKDFDVPEFIHSVSGKMPPLLHSASAKEIFPDII